MKIWQVFYFGEKGEILSVHVEANAPVKAYRAFIQKYGNKHVIGVDFIANKAEG